MRELIYKNYLTAVIFSTLGEFIGFDSITLVPYEPKLIDYTLMNPSQIKWLNRYNQKVLDLVVPRLNEFEDAVAIKWIEERTEYVDPWISFKKEL